MEPDGGIVGGGAPSAEDLVFASGVAERLQAYVYLLIDPRSDDIFYVGKGRGNRAYAHAQAALSLDVSEDPKHLKLQVIQAIHRAGRAVRIEILRHGLTDDEAFLVEASAIDLVRRIHHELPPTNLQGGHGSGVGLATVEELAARYAARRVVVDDAILLIRPHHLWRKANTPAERYEATRGWWYAAARSRSRVGHAAAVVDGIVRDVWRIDRWEDDAATGRSAFVGEIDPLLEAKYAWADVSSLLARGARNPLKYVIPTADTERSSDG